MNLISIPAFGDNYIWLLDDRQGRCIIVDPGEAQPVLNAAACGDAGGDPADPPSSRSRRRRGAK